MNSIRESCKLLLTDVEDDLQHEAVEFWQSVATHHPHWQQLQASNDSSLRQRSIGFNALTMCALAIVGQQLRQQNQTEKIANLDRINWQLNNPAWEICKLNHRIVKNRSTIQAMAKYILEEIIA